MAQKHATDGDCTLAKNYDWDYTTAYAICMAESGGKSQAYNPSNSDGSNDAGLFQVNSIHVTSGLIGDKQRFDAEANVKAAYAIYKGSGFSAWATYNNGLYQRFL